eukprot:5696880-Alexandrium_andersonii.AAC.1
MPSNLGQYHSVCIASSSSCSQKGHFPVLPVACLVRVPVQSPSIKALLAGTLRSGVRPARALWTTCTST